MKILSWKVKSILPNLKPQKKQQKNKSDIYSFETLMLEATCCKGVHKPKCIELTMTNRSRSF